MTAGFALQNSMICLFRDCTFLYLLTFGVLHKYLCCNYL